MSLLGRFLASTSKMFLHPHRCQKMDFMVALLAALMLSYDIILVADAKCPFHFGSDNNREIADGGAGRLSRMLLTGYESMVSKLNLNAVKADLKVALVDSKDFWPADNGNYGPLIIRLAWHCSGSYRLSDGRGGCNGARIRFNPELSWPDNTNLDKARRVLWPVKQKYGDALSWGDLIVLAGNTAIESMGGPTIGFCGGRIDDADGSASVTLSFSMEQEAVAPCEVNGNCSNPLGASTMGLIYVNPEGPLAQPVPELSAPQIRDVFGRMGMNDSETVALIGGGHAFGKLHGSCPTGAGPNPTKQPWNPWPGTCGDGPMKGKGANAFTSGFEGPWTTNQTKWDNEYFQNLLNYDWELYMGSGGHHQWQPKHFNESDTEPLPEITMLTTDIALLKDPIYLELVKIFAANQTALDIAFSHAWYKLTTRDMGPATRCLGSLVPPPQPFQGPLPPPPSQKADVTAITNDILRIMRTASTAMAGDVIPGISQPYYGALFVTLAWQCASTFRETDYTGGCNGARIRFSPQKDWPQNVGMDRVLAVLAPVKARFPYFTIADLIVLAGNTALSTAGAKKIKFCGGRSDANPNERAVVVEPPRVLADKLAQLHDNAVVMGLSPSEMVALQARPRSTIYQQLLGYSGSWGGNPSVISNNYFKVLLDNEWENVTSSSGLLEMRQVGSPSVFMTPIDLAVKWDPVFSSIAQVFATNAQVFYANFASGWNKMMNADRFKGPVGNQCD